MKILINIKRWLNSKKVHLIAYESVDITAIQKNIFAHVQASLGERPIGKILVSYNHALEASSMLCPEFLVHSSVIKIDDIVIYKEWRRFGIGRKLVEQCIQELKLVLPDDIWVYGMITDTEVEGFWETFGFSFKDNFMYCKIKEIQFNKIDE